MQKHFLIPLRKGSVSIPNKNINLLGGKHLFRWSLDAILESNLSEGDQVWIATNIDEMQSIIDEFYPNNDTIKIFWRSEANASSTSPKIDIVNEFIYANHFNDEDWLIEVQATSPFTTKEEFCLAIEHIDSKKYDSLIACARLKKFRWSEEGEPLDYNWETKPRRQEYKGLLVESGAFYASKIGCVKESKKLISGKVGVIELGEDSLLEIDEPMDWFIAEKYIEQRK